MYIVPAISHQDKKFNSDQLIISRLPQVHHIVCEIKSFCTFRFFAKGSDQCQLRSNVVNSLQHLIEVHQTICPYQHISLLCIIMRGGPVSDHCGGSLDLYRLLLSGGGCLLCLCGLFLGKRL